MSANDTLSNAAAEMKSPSLESVSIFIGGPRIISAKNLVWMGSTLLACTNRWNYEQVSLIAVPIRNGCPGSVSKSFTSILIHVRQWLSLSVYWCRLELNDRGKKIFFKANTYYVTRVGMLTE